MISERTNREQPSCQMSYTLHETPLTHIQREEVHAALAIMLGPETHQHARVRATRQLAKHGVDILPLVLSTLNKYPEITSPTWPWWPLQYEQSGHLLLALCQQAQISLNTLLQHPSISHPVGPVLWTSIMEAASLQPQEDYEDLLCSGLATPWETVRYAAAMALAMHANKKPLRRTSLDALLAHQDEREAIPVRLTAAYALLSSGESRGLEALIQCMNPLFPDEARKAAMFVISTEFPIHFSTTQRERLSFYLIRSLHDSNAELTLQAAHALSAIALPSILPSLAELLYSSNSQTQIAILVSLEEMAHQNSMRRMIRYHGLPARVMPFLRTEVAEVRRQACYTLAACGGEYVAAVFGTTILNQQPGHLEVLEALRLLRGALRTPARHNIIRWLLSSLHHAEEEVKITVLDSLAYLLWKARTRRYKQAWQEICQEILQHSILNCLLNDQSAWVRQRSIELLGLLGHQVESHADLQVRLKALLCLDEDSGVRACAAYVCGQMNARWAIPELLRTLLDEDEHVARTSLHSLEQLAEADDILVIQAIQELVHSSNACPSPSVAFSTLIQEARTFLKKWRRMTRRKAKKKLHSSP